MEYQKFHPYKGVLVSFEGQDGSGTTTQRNLTAAWLEEKEYDVVKTREPGGTPFAEKLRSILLETDYKLESLTELLLFSTARRNHILKKIIPALKKSQIVLTDRFFLSSLVYQGYTSGMELKKFKQVTKIATGGLKPDLQIVLSLSRQEALDRMEKDGKKKDRIESKNEEFQRKVVKGYEEISDSEPNTIKIDGDRPKQEVFADIKEEFEKFIIQP